MGSISIQTDVVCSKGSPPRVGSQFWRSLDELAGDEKFIASLRREFPEYANRLNDGATRRQFLQLMGAGLALAGMQGCDQPQEKIVPFVQASEQIIPGKPLYYATAMTHDGAGIGLLAESHMGRPVKIEGNPLHPAVPEVMASAAEGNPLRFGATDAFSQASVLSLYDPDRSQTVLRAGQISTWEALAAELQSQLNAMRDSGGRGLRLLTESVVSPTLAEQLRQLLELYPNAEWHQYEPINHDNELLGNRLAFGSDVQTIHHVDAADVILSLDADFLAEGPMHLRNARHFATRRRVGGAAGEESAAMNRLYVVESGLTLTGAAADHRLPLEPRAVAAFTLRLAETLGLALNQIEGTENAIGGGDQIPQAWMDAVAADLQQARGRSLVIAGRAQPPFVHAVVHWINAALENVGTTVEYVEPIAARPEPQVESLRSLVEAIRSVEVRALVILGGNPVYTAPADFKFAAALEQVPFAIHLSEYEDETSARCLWHIPELHFLEAWSDTRGGDGTASIVQPLIAPLRGGKSAHELLAALLGNPTADSYELVRAFWLSSMGQVAEGEDPDSQWQQALHDGVIANTGSPPVQPMIRADFTPALGQQLSLPLPLGEGRGEGAFLQGPHPNPLPEGEGITVVFGPDPTVWDGRYANNGWLQELPRPLTTLTWDNAALIAPATAEKLQLKNGDVVAITVEMTTIEVPVLVTPGQPANVVTLHLGYGRDRAGRIGNGVGTNVYPIRFSGAMWNLQGASLRAVGRTHALALTQHHHVMEGRNLVRAGTLAEFQEHPDHPAFMSAGHAPAEDVSIYPEYKYDGYKWGMVINQSACIGCNACVLACQAENNVPIVGKGQVLNSREMHWLRIDHYYRGEPDNPEHYHQPMLCQHCELAPCEPVCPVAATTHSREGLNEMTYNRCIGTRYCSNNCPYKVRRFNFLDYNRELREDAVLQLQSNPDVSVRSRGVMEKCTFCVQRISAGRIEAEKQDRTIRDGEVVTACQAACPTEAIVFGDLNDPQSRVRQESTSPLNYSVLGELNTRPRTTYQAVVKNPNPALTMRDS
jgi:MoCo/4Fe-4S cofactor protein with predicted Tat translocation signal